MEEDVGRYHDRANPFADGDSHRAEKFQHTSLSLVGSYFSLSGFGQAVSRHKSTCTSSFCALSSPHNQAFEAARPPPSLLRSLRRFAIAPPTPLPCQLEQSIEVLRLEKMQAEEDALQAHRYIEVGRMHLCLWRWARRARHPFDSHLRPI